MTWGVWWAYTPTGWQICFGLGQVTLALLAQLPNPEPAPAPESIGVWPDGTEVVDEDHYPDWLIEDVSAEDWPT